jgi:hypothetical protein
MATGFELLEVLPFLAGIAAASVFFEALPGPDHVPGTALQVDPTINQK